jgi:hypothetical protein
MPKIADHQSSESTKLLLIGNSSSGKTGALCSLAAAGYNVRVLDYDNGADVVKNLLTGDKSPYPKTAQEHFEYIPMIEPRKSVGGKLVPVKAEVWTKTAQMLMEWQEGTKGEAGYVNYGSVTTWGPKDVLVFDSLTTLSKAAMRFQLQLNGRLGQRPWEGDWGDAQDLIRQLLEMVTDASVRCNVIVICHYKYIEVQGMTKAYPNTLGKALPPEVGIFFNNALLVERTGIGSASRRKILTNPTGVIDLKTSSPFNVAAEYPLESGLADFFKAVRGEAATAPTPAKPIAVPVPGAAA